MTKLHAYTVMCPPTMAQEAAVEALRNGDEDVQEMHREYNQRRRVVVNRLNEMGLDCFEPGGAFYVFPSIARTGLSSEEFCHAAAGGGEGGGGARPGLRRVRRGLRPLLLRHLHGVARRGHETHGRVR